MSRAGSDAAPRETSAAFWNRVARRYAAMPLRDPDAYQRSLNDIADRLSAGDKVLEIGCGTGTSAVQLARHVHRYVATDTAAEMIAIAAERVAEAGVTNAETHVAGPGAPSMPEGPFDVVIALNVIHLFDDRAAALEDIARRLRPGGLFISKTPCLSGLWRAIAPVVALMRLFGKAPHVRFLSGDRIERDLHAAGFRIVARATDPQRPPRFFFVAVKDVEATDAP